MIALSSSPRDSRISSTLDIDDTESITSSISWIALDIENLSIKLGNLSIIHKGKLNVNYNEDEASDYMKNDNIEIHVDISNGSKNFIAYSMDLTKEYIKINADYRT